MKLHKPDASAAALAAQRAALGGPTPPAESPQESAAPPPIVVGAATDAALHGRNSQMSVQSLWAAGGPHTYVRIYIHTYIHTYSQWRWAVCLCGGWGVGGGRGTLFPLYVLMT